MNTSMAGSITARREALGLSQSALAARAGVSRAHLNQVESGKIALPSADFRRKLASALGVPHVQLLVWAGELTAAEAALDDQPPALAHLHATIDEVLRPILDRPEALAAVVESLRHTVKMIEAVSSPNPDAAEAPSAADDESPQASGPRLEAPQDR